MEGNYNGSYWADQAFPESYRRAFVSASRQIAEHLQARGWTDTLFHGFLNNKNNFKANGWLRGSSPWLLAEPANFQDYWALRYFAQAFHEESTRPGQGQGKAQRVLKARVFHAWSSASTTLARNGGVTRWTAWSTTTSSARRCGSIRAWSSTVSAGSARSWLSTAVRTRCRLRTSSPSAGASTPGRWGPTACCPGRRSAQPDRGSRLTSFRFSTHFRTSAGARAA